MHQFLSSDRFEPINNLRNKADGFGLWYFGLIMNYVSKRTLFA